MGEELLELLRHLFIFRLPPAIPNHQGDGVDARLVDGSPQKQHIAGWASEVILHVNRPIARSGHGSSTRQLGTVASGAPVLRCLRCLRRWPLTALVCGFVE